MGSMRVLLVSPVQGVSMELESASAASDMSLGLTVQNGRANYLSHKVSLVLPARTCKSLTQTSIQT